ncbi:DUF1703-domain-containing protein [Rozella allomycis CSF55]|uniref:AAA-ATPase-like domain-containing protein n=1 Tax=Rozella allomycis (strain CSF55) TaxID=988480 RepID=A0A075APT3_ROZAC|nr:AAA-ATPase-like domain-containing protein [Rozella allomycis CSF55]RKP21169.1 DUF1703-domain-containing protein [Rozella allomycis CSF55]|eukprot:EPZ32219.1 AAA-ATPase-like domain-containing protein [Rozella allomycis CSF55]
MKPLLVGPSSFEEFRQTNAVFVDKTHFIEEFIQSASEVDIILRPRRFGKSLNLSMLNSFFSIGTNPNLFKGLYIFDREFEVDKGPFTSSKKRKVEDQGTFMEKYCGKYPVIHMNLKDATGKSFEECIDGLWEVVKVSARPHHEAMKGVCPNDPLYGMYKESSSTPKLTNVRKCLAMLMKILYEYHKTQVIVLIDEYDAPLNNAHRKGFYDEAIDFFVSFFSMALKDNNALYKACLMGILEIRGTDILSSWNNVTIYSFLDDKYSSCFGFTLEEVRQLGVDEEELNEVVHWYNGYHFGNSHVMNPWSVNSWLLKGKQFRNYWIGTANYSELQNYLKGHEQLMLMEVFNLFFDGDPFDINLNNTQVNYDDEWDTPKVVTFLVLSGYLTFHQNKVIIPNTEVKNYWETQILPLFKTAVKNKYGDQVRALFDPRGEFSRQGCLEFMQDVLLNASSQDLTRRQYPEAPYHCFYFGIFLGCLHEDDSVLVTSIKEVALGRYDIRIQFVKFKTAFIFEFKVDRSGNNTDQDPGAARQQIHNTQYYHDLHGYSVHLIGAAFYKKSVALSHEFIQLE